MKIRHKITLWISGTALLAALGFSSFIFSELIEEPLRLVDRELSFMGEAFFQQMEANNVDEEDWQIHPDALPYPPDMYWIKVVAQNNKLLYHSRLTEFTEIPENTKKGHRYNARVVVPREKVNLHQDDNDNVIFRVRRLKRKIHGHWLTMHIAKPMEELEKELLDVLAEASVMLLICFVTIVLVSYYLAGRILQPVVSMTTLAAEISESSLEQRIPPGKNKDELAVLAQAFNHMLDGLHYSFERQRQFISNGSHELKSPLTRLILLQEELVQRQDLPEMTHEDLGRQLKTMHWMKKLIQNLLSLSYLEHQDTLSLESFDLVKLIRGVVENYQEMFAATSIHVQVDLPDEMPIHADRIKLQQLFVNLIDNGIRYNDPEQGQLRITAQKKTASQCIIDIENSGQTIPESEHDLVFDQFYRLEKSRATAHGGVGLGLTISKKIVEMHGGQIEVKPGDLGGTMVRVTLPC